MRRIAISDFEKENLNPIFINALRQFWKNTNAFQCIGTPKKQNLLLFLDGCRITYTDKDGVENVADSGDVVLTPVGSEYRAVLSDFLSPSSHTVGINFLLKDESGEECVIGDDITVFRGVDISEMTALFDRAALGDGMGKKVSGRIILLEILSRLAEHPSDGGNRTVSEAIGFLYENIEKNPSVTELARHCCVSEVYLRRKFKEYMGVSPAEYKTELRLNKAASYLRFGDISVQEISDTLGYATVSHFIKEFKKRFGLSPLKYRKDRNGNAE